MIRNFILVALRNIRKYKGYALIHIVGLALGLAGFLAIVFCVQFERGVDGFHRNGKRIFLVVRENRTQEYSEMRSNTGAPMAPRLVQDFPGIERAVRFTSFRNEIIKAGEKQFLERQFFFADPEVLAMFTFPLVQGDPATVLEDPFSVLLTRSTAEKYFGSEDPTGKILNVLFYGRYADFKITGVLEDIPADSHLDFDFLASYESLRSLTGDWFMTNHWDSPTWNYVRLKPGVSFQEMNRLLPAFVERNLDRGRFASSALSLMPLKDVYFRAPGPAIGRRGNERLLDILTVISFFVLLIAAINFMILSTSRAAVRSREVGMRKVLGARRSHLIGQFLGEALVFSFLSLFLALVFVRILMPVLGRFIGRDILSSPPGMLQVLTAILATIGIGFLSGIYPALFLSSFQPVSTLKGKSRAERTGLFVRKALVLGQFSVSIVLVIGMLLVSRQVRFLQNQDLGFNKEGVVVIPIRDRKITQMYETLKARWLAIPSVGGVTASSMEPGVGSQNGIFLKARQVDEADMGIIYVDHDFLKTLGIKVDRGRDFSQEIGSDAVGAILINRAAVERLGWEDGVGEPVQLYFKEQGKILPMYQGTVVGVVDNFRFRDLYTSMQPILMKIDPMRFEHILLRIDAADPVETLKRIETVWKEFQFDQPFEVTFLSDDIRLVYRSLDDFSAVARIATTLAVGIACLGLLALTAFNVERRTKEIGVRKVLGDSVSGLAVRLIKELLKPILLANAIAWPAAYWIMSRWLQNFNFRISIQIWDFLLASLLALCIAVLTVAVQTIRAAQTNPVDCLRYE